MDACAICMNEFGAAKVDRLYCGHSFHCDCIHIWTDRSDTCPVCRAWGVERDLTEPPMDLSMYTLLDTPLKPQITPFRIRRVVTKTGRKIILVFNDSKVKIITRNT